MCLLFSAHFFNIWRENYSFNIQIFLHEICQSDDPIYVHFDYPIYVHFDYPIYVHFDDPIYVHFDDPIYVHFDDPIFVHFDAPWRLAGKGVNAVCVFCTTKIMQFWQGTFFSNFVTEKFTSNSKVVYLAKNCV